MTEDDGLCSRRHSLKCERNDKEHEANSRCHWFKPYAIALANDPVNALFTNSNLQNGLNVHKGSVTYKAVADALGYTYVPADEALKA